MFEALMWLLLWGLAAAGLLVAIVVVLVRIVGRQFRQQQQKLVRNFLQEHGYVLGSQAAFCLVDCASMT